VGRREYLTDPAAWWIHRARVFRIRWLAAWWVSRFLYVSLPAALVVGATVVVGRGLQWNPVVLVAVAAVLVGSAAVAAGILARLHALTEEGALVRIDEALGLQSRLPAAAAGVGPWPAAPVTFDDGLRWQWASILRQGSPAVALIALSIWAPLPGVTKRVPLPPSLPSSIAQAQEWINQMKEEKLVRPEAIAEFQQQVDQLSQAPQEDWYRHDQLEAAENLRDSLESSMGNVSANLQTVASLLDQARQDGASPDLPPAAKEELARALSELTQGSLPVNLERLAQNGGIDPSQIRQLSEEEWKSRKEQLAEGSNPGSGGQSPGEGEGEDGSGKGGVNRGPGEAPLTLGATSPELAGRNEPVAAPLEDATPGDLLRTELRAPKPADAPDPAASGGSAGTGTGGNRVGTSNITPDEQRAVRRFFQ